MNIEGKEICPSQNMFGLLPASLLYCIILGLWSQDPVQWEGHSNTNGNAELSILSPLKERTRAKWTYITKYSVTAGEFQRRVPSAMCILSPIVVKRRSQPNHRIWSRIFLSNWQALQLPDGDFATSFTPTHSHSCGDVSSTCCSSGEDSEEDQRWVG